MRPENREKWIQYATRTIPCGDLASLIRHNAFSLYRRKRKKRLASFANPFLFFRYSVNMIKQAHRVD